LSASGVTGQSSSWSQLLGEFQTEQEIWGGSSRWSSTECNESLWLWDGESLETQEREHAPLEVGTRGLVWDSRLRGSSGCYSELHTVWNCDITIWCKLYS
jgi:hypothetical protein